MTPSALSALESVLRCPDERRPLAAMIPLETAVLRDKDDGVAGGGQAPLDILQGERYLSRTPS